MVYGYCKDLNRRTAADKILPDEAFNFAKYPKYGGYQRRIASMIYTFFYKKLLLVVLKMKMFLIKN